jgi:ribosomal-protein-alanine N-acetyltransferase
LTRAPAILGEMRERDLDEVEAIAGRSFDRPWSRAALRAELDKPFSRCRVVRTEPSGAIRGYAIWWIVAGEQHLLTIAIDPDARGEGLARVLMEEMLAEGARAGAKECFLEVRAGNEAAIALYRAHGFSILDVRPRYYDDGEDACVMVHRLG